ncbi:MAG: lamin tail domain-containing protein, partial [Bacteroidales bacterium]|nr:lamin tail domain-containing protein [Bacteroidales bacterium]
NNSGSTGGENLMAIMPGYYGDFNGKWINMDVYTETDTDSLIVGVLTDPTDPATFTGVDTILFPEDNVWASFPAMLSNYSGSGNYIAFRHTSTDSYEDIHIDNVILENAPAGPIFGISPSPIDMGAVRYDHPDTLIKTVEVTNEGTGMLTVTDAVLSVSGAGNFAMIDTNTYPKSLAALETMSLQIKFYGSSVGQVSANLNVTANSVAHTTPVHGEIIDGIINTFPYMETMDHDGNFPFYWKTSATDSYDWNVGTETTSSYTGATMDHTTGTGYFAYTEASGAGTGDTAMMVTPQLDFTTISRPQMSFWYHMHGSDIGTLQIDVAENGTWYNAVATISGEQHANQGDAWMKKNVSLTGFPNADSVRFTAISDGSYEGDISIDDIAFGMAPNVDLPADTGICEGSMLMLDAGYNADWTYEWYLDTMVTVYSTSQNIVADSAAKYYVKVTNGYGFTTVDSMMLTINPIPVVDLTTASGMVYCESAMADTLIGTPAGGTYAGPGVTNNMFHPSVAGTGQHVLYYHYTSPEGCDAMDSMMVYVNPLPAVDAGQDVDVCEGDSVTLTATYNNLFFSEYIEGSSNNKAIEIYNGTGKPVHLDNYAVLTNYNGNPWSGEYTFPSGTVLNDGETYVIANSSANATILAQADETLAYNEKGYMMGYNGDDVRALVQYTPNGDTLILDQIGLYDLIDPGSGWDVAGVTNGTNNQTMVRKAWAGPNLGDWATSAGTDSISSEWYVMPQDDASDLGMHTTNIGNKAYATVSFMWNTGATTPSITVSPASTQTYTVTLTDASGCTNTDEVTVTVNPTPMVDLGADTMFVCAADSAVLTPGNFAAYSWSTGETTSSIVVDSAGIGMGSETYSVSVTDQNGCMGMDSIVVMFVDYPSVTIAGPDTMLYYTGSAILDAGAGYATYNWSNGATTQDIYIDISDVNMGMNTFSVTVTNDYGCAATDTKDVFAQNDLGLEDASDGMDISVYPNPNDGVFTLEINGPNQDFNLEIMNVNGQLIQSEYINADEFSKEYDLSNLAKGVYYIRLMNDDMNKTQKLIIK